MGIQRKLNLARYKKTLQGMIDFAILIEQADPQTREKIIESTHQQDPDFLVQVMKRVVFFEELIYVDEGVVAELLSVVSPKVLAYAILKMPENFQKSLSYYMGFRGQRQMQDEWEKMGDVSDAMVLGAQKQILKIARDLESKGKFTFEVLASPRFQKFKKLG